MYFAIKKPYTNRFDLVRCQSYTRQTSYELTADFLHIPVTDLRLFSPKSETQHMNAGPSFCVYAEDLVAVLIMMFYIITCMIP